MPKCAAPARCAKPCTMQCTIGAHDVQQKQAIKVTHDFQHCCGAAAGRADLFLARLPSPAPMSVEVVIASV